MPRRSSKKSHPEPDLFPFLSILACTIGTLILLIIVMTLQSLGKGRSVTILARAEAGQNQQKQPRYVECQADGIVIHPQGTFVPRASLDSPQAPLIPLLQQLARRKDREYLIVVVRPQGIEVFKQLRALVENRGIDLGYEPLEEGWRLNLKPEAP
jgi:hypothetical protein